MAGILHIVKPLRMTITRLFKDFLTAKSGGLVLIACTILSLLIANSGFSTEYQNFWHLQVAGHSITHWVNDGLMSIFFLLIGLELEREIYKGELSNLKDALLPIFGALGGILIPAGLFMLFNYGTATQSGAGIPMATDIAFALGILSLLGNRVPLSLKVFLTALAVIDDLGAILIIAVFYTKAIIWTKLMIALGISLALIFNRLKKEPDSIYTGWSSHVVFHVTIRGTCYHYRCVAGFCCAFWKW
jgi:NhaA family Na+:H+ antiporter